MASPVPPAVSDSSDSSAHPDGRPIDAAGAVATKAGPPEAGTGRPLGNRNVGILCADAQRPEALLLQRVVSELGARTALVRPNLDAAGALFSVEHTARVLSLLYDAMICVDLPAPLVDRLRECARIPVLSDLALPVAAAGQSARDVPELGRQILAGFAGAPV